MPKLPIADEIAKELELLSPEQQRRVLAFVKGMTPITLRGTPGSEAASLSGTMSAEDAAAIALAIEEGCEQVNEDGWQTPPGQ